MNNLYKKNIIIEKMNNYNINSLCIYNNVFSSDQFQYFGDANQNSIYEAASLTKVLFAFLVLKLSMNKIIDLDKPLYQYDVIFKSSSDKRFNLITARHILSHSSGLENWSHQDDLPIHFTPGFSFMYSGEGYQFLQKVVEKITNKSITYLFKENIFIPFDMNNSYLSFNDKSNDITYLNNNLIKCYDSNKICNINNRHIEIPNVAYSLYTTILDYQKFCYNVFVKNDYPEIKNLMFKKTTIINNNLSWGLGISNINDSFFWQWGDNGNYKNFFWFDNLKNQMFLFFSNSYNGLLFIKDYLINIYPEFKYVLPIIEE